MLQCKSCYQNLGTKYVMNRRTFLCFPEFKEKALTLSYDDGVIYDKRLVEIFKKYNLKATFNLNSGNYGNKTYKRMTKQECVDLFKDSGMEVAAHGYKHLSLATVDSASAIYDVITDRKELENTFQRIIKGFAYASGSYDDKVIEILQNCGISYSRTIVQTYDFELPNSWYEWHTTCHHEYPNLMDLADRFISSKRPERDLDYTPKLMYVWGHSYEFNNNDNWFIIEKFAEFIGNREDIYYATNCEIYDYVTAYDNLVWSVDNSIIQNKSAIDVYINYYGEKRIIKAGQTIKL